MDGTGAEVKDTELPVQELGVDAAGAAELGQAAAGAMEPAEAAAAEAPAEATVADEEPAAHAGVALAEPGSALAATETAAPTTEQPGTAELGTAAQQPDQPTSAPAAANGTAQPSAPAAAAAAEEPDYMREPPHGAEVFVGGVPRGATEEQLRSFAETVGPVHSATLVRDPGTTQNKGYGFVKFQTAEAGRKAISTLNQTEMADFPGLKVRFQQSQSKHKLFIGNIPKDISQEALEERLKGAAHGVVHVERVMSKDSPGLCRGFCFVEFHNHGAAAAAKTTLGAPQFRIGDRQLTVSYAEPKQSELNTEAVKSVYVGGLPQGTKDSDLQTFFEGQNLGKIIKVVVPPPKAGRTQADFGFVHFEDRQAATDLIAACERADAPLQLRYPEGSENVLQIKLARPQVNMQSHGEGGRGGYGGYGASGRGGGGYSSGYGHNPSPGRGAYGGRGGGGGGGGGHSGGYGYDGQGSFGYSNPNYAAPAAYGAGGYAGGGAPMQMVPMMMPNGQMGYMLQQPEAQGYGAPASYGADRRGYHAAQRGRRPAPY